MCIKSPVLLAAAAAAVAWTNPSSSAADEYFIIDLGREIVPAAVSDGRGVVGGLYRYLPDRGVEQILESPGGFVGAGNLLDINSADKAGGYQGQQVNGPGAPCPFKYFPVPSTAGIDAVYGLNDADDYAGQCDLDCSSNSYIETYRACANVNETVRQFEIAALLPYAFGSARAINLSGQSVGEIHQSDSLGNVTGDTRAFLASASGAVLDIGIISGDSYSVATGISEDAKVVGYYKPQIGSGGRGTFRNYFIYDSVLGGGTFTDLGEGGYGHDNIAINDAGLIAATKTISFTEAGVPGLQYANRASLYSSGSWTQLSTLLAGDQTDSTFRLTLATDLNNSADIVGVMTIAGDSAAHGYIASKTNFGIRDFSYDALGGADPVVYRPALGQWYIYGSGVDTSQQWGLPGDVPLKAKFTADSTAAAVTVWRPTTGTWYTKGQPAGQFGLKGDYPVSADIDGDGLADQAVFRAYLRTKVGKNQYVVEEGQWYIKRSSSQTVLSIQWGLRGDLPVTGDFDGDGRTEIGVYRPSTGQWFVLYSTKNYSKTAGDYLVVQWGLNGDHPLPADYDGDGRADLAVWRPAEGNWYLCRSVQGFSCSTAARQDRYQFGLPGDVPIHGDFNNDQRADLIVWRPSSGTWYWKQILHQTVTSQQWGLPNDIPVGESILSRVARLR